MNTILNNKRVSNQYTVEYKGIIYPTLSTASRAANIKRTTLTKAVYRKYAKQTIENPKITITVQNETFIITKFTVNR